jgi:hypothetical protein
MKYLCDLSIHGSSNFRILIWCFSNLFIQIKKEEEEEETQKVRI